MAREPGSHHILRGVGKNPACLLELFSQLFNGDLPNWQPLDPGLGLPYVRRFFFSFMFLSQCLHFRQLSAQSRRAKAG